MDSEYRAGVHQVDAVLPGGTSALMAKSQGFLSPIQPALLLPEVKDPSVWIGGKFPFFDKDGFIVGYLSQRVPPVLRNSDLVKEGQITTFADLLKPEWNLPLPKYPAHPNAAIIFLNWFLSKEGQTVAFKSMGFGSSRTDVPATGVDPMFVLKPGEKYTIQSEEFNVTQTQLTPTWKAVLTQAGY